MQGVILDESGNFNLEEAFSNARISTEITESSEEEITEDESEEETLPSVQTDAPSPKSNVKWTDEDIESITAPPYTENESSTTPILAQDFRKRSHFNGRPYSSWGSLFAPLYGTPILPLAPMTQKLWWQIARDAVPADTNTTGKPKKSFNDKIKRKGK